MEKLKLFCFLMLATIVSCETVDMQQYESDDKSPASADAEQPSMDQMPDEMSTGTDAYEKTLEKDDGGLPSDDAKRKQLVCGKSQDVEPGPVEHYAVIINGDELPIPGLFVKRFWEDVSYSYTMLVDHLGYNPENIIVLSGDGVNDKSSFENKAEYTTIAEATRENIKRVFLETEIDWKDPELELDSLQRLACMDKNDQLLLLITGHGHGYVGPEAAWYASQQELGRDFDGFGRYYSSWQAQEDDDEKDYRENGEKVKQGEFPLKMVMLQMKGAATPHGLNQWFRKALNDNIRYKVVSEFEDLEIEGTEGIFQNKDVLLELITDHPDWDSNLNGKVDPEEEETFRHWDTNGNGQIELDEEKFEYWGKPGWIDHYTNNQNEPIQTLAAALDKDPDAVPVLFDYGLDNKLDVDFLYQGARNTDGIPTDLNELTVDGTDLDNDGFLESLDVNLDKDLDDWVSLDEAIQLRSTNSRTVDNMTDDELAKLVDGLTFGELVVVVQNCFGGGLVDDLSFSGEKRAGEKQKRVIMTANIEEYSSHDNRFIRGVMGAFAGVSELGATINADTNGDTRVSVLEAFQYGADNANDETKLQHKDHPQYDDNGDREYTEHPSPFTDGDGSIGAEMFLPPPTEKKD
jgi:hypothetical protein